MPKLTGTFDANGQESAELRIEPDQSYVLSLTPDPSLTGSIQLLNRAEGSLATLEVVQTYTDTLALTEYTNRTGKVQYLRVRCITLDDEVPETVDYRFQSLLSKGRFVCEERAKVGATAGWVVNAANDTALMATLPAGETDSTLVLRVDGLHVGDVIEGFYPIGQVESGGNTASLTVEMRKMTAAAADVTDASVATTGAVEFTADAALGRITMPVDNVNAEIGEGETYYFLVTGTTAAATDIALQGIVIQHRHGTY